MVQSVPHIASASMVCLGVLQIYNMRLVCLVKIFGSRQYACKTVYSHAKICSCQTLLTHESVASWPGLCTILIRVNKAELSKKTLNAEPFRLLKALVTVASDGRRSGGRQI
jgi:hypothetical protein